jgi:hypothetical protein
MQGTPYVPPTDEQGLASGLVLREVHAALLRGAEGRGLASPGAAQPQR